MGEVVVGGSQAPLTTDLTGIPHLRLEYLTFRPIARQGTRKRARELQGKGRNILARYAMKF